MQPESQFEYDVAFSFLAQDEDLATALNDLLQDRFRTFLYSERQREIAGTDGEQSFNTVFSEQSRLVVVLYRSGWGDTPWTRIEQTAIRNRAFEQGHDFVTFIPLDTPPTVPKWLPKTQLWVGLERWGLNGAAAVISARIEQLGGEPQEETVAGRAARFQRAQDFLNEKSTFFRSDVGVNAGTKEFAELSNRLKTLVGELPETFSTAVQVQVFQAGRDTSILLSGLGPGLTINWHIQYKNALDGAMLNLKVWDHPPAGPGTYTFDRPTELASLDFTLELFPDRTVGWLHAKSDRRYTSGTLAEMALKLYLDWADKIYQDRAGVEFGR